VPIYSISSASRKPDIVACSTGVTPESWRAWWQAEAANQGTDWANLLRQHRDAFRRLCERVSS
jgi:hypothetical protein